MTWSVVAFDHQTQPWLKTKIDTYQKRLKPWIELEFRLLNPSKYATVEQNQKKDLALLKDHKLLSSSSLIVLEPRGRGVTTEQLATLCNQWRINHKHLCFVIGPSYGLHPNWQAMAVESLKLSDLTLTHEFAQLLLFEQIYRSFCILNHHPYHQ